MIKTLSPHYITTPFSYDTGSQIVYCTKYTLEIFIWTGSRLDTQTEPTYSVTINNPTQSFGDSKINISRLINDYLEFVPAQITSTDLIPSNNQIWVRTQAKYYVDNIFINVPYHVNTQIALKGYGYGMSGENPDTPDNKILMRVGDYTISEGGKFIVPIELDEVPPLIPEIVITSVSQIGVTLESSVSFTYVGVYSTFYVEIENVSTSEFSIDFFDGVISPQSLDFLDYGEYNIKMFAYDSTSNTNIESNTYNAFI